MSRRNKQDDTVATTNRGKWIVQRIADSFSLGETAVGKAICQAANSEMLEGFLRGESNPHLFVYYQRRPVDPFNIGGDTISESKGTEIEWGQDPELFFTSGTEDGLQGKAAYFIRVGPEPIDTSVAADSNLLYGEVGVSKDDDATDISTKSGTSDILSDIGTLLEVFYAPSVASIQTPAWGGTTVAEQDELKDEINRFSSEVSMTIKSLEAVIDLKTVDNEFIESPRTHAAKEGTVGKKKGFESSYNKKDSYEELRVQHYRDVIESWCDTLEKHVMEERDAVSEKEARMLDGPWQELEYWRRRTQKLTNMTGRVKAKECNDVVQVLTSYAKGGGENQRPGPSQGNVYQSLNRWKAIDITITEKLNESRDNEKYLKTLEKFFVPLYEGTPSEIIETLPAMMNSLKMIYTIARYYNTTDRMTGLMCRITNQLIFACCDTLLKDPAKEGDPREKKSWARRKKRNPLTSQILWNQDADTVLNNLRQTLQVNEVYQHNYQITKEKMLEMPSGKQFEMNEQIIFKRFNSYSRRLIKLIDLFEQIQSWRQTESHKLEGMEKLNMRAKRIFTDFQNKRHDLLDADDTKFDRDFVELNVKVSRLEASLLDFINLTFDGKTGDINRALKLLNKFHLILDEKFHPTLEEKFAIIFQSYGQDLESVQKRYEQHKQAPPFSRNLPPVAGNISWVRLLMHRIEQPMKIFETNPAVLGSRDGKKIVKMYNKLARTLVAFEYLWYRAWVDSIEHSRAGLQATLLIRHPEDSQLYVNLDPEILQLIREAKVLDRMGIDVPETARTIMLQEDRIKYNYLALKQLLSEYDVISRSVIPVTTSLLRPMINHLEYIIRPGMITLTWTSMNVGTFVEHVKTELRRLSDLIDSINDIIENRIENMLKAVSKSLLVTVPPAKTFHPEDFVITQEEFIDELSIKLQGYNMQIESAVEDLITIVMAYQLDPHVESVSPEDCDNLRKHYNHFMYQALLNCCKNSLNAIKKRMGTRAPAGGLGAFTLDVPFFQVDVHLDAPSCRLVPSLDDIQSAINQVAKAVLSSTVKLTDWGQQDIPESERITFFQKVAKDIEIVRVVLLLTGSIQGLRNQVATYLDSFGIYQWLWQDDKDQAYKNFIAGEPTLDDYDRELKRFSDTAYEINAKPSRHTIKALSLMTTNMKTQLSHMAGVWKVSFSKMLHVEAKTKMMNLVDYIKTTESWLKRNKPTDLQTVSVVMKKLKALREKESSIDSEITPVLDMYDMLNRYLPEGYLDREEADRTLSLRSSWRRLVESALRTSDELSTLQQPLKKKLTTDITDFKNNVLHFREDWDKNGPGVAGLKPTVAVERLNRFKAEYSVRDRKWELYKIGESLFGLPETQYPAMVKTKKELGLLETLYGLYVDVHESVDVDWPALPWQDVMSEMEVMTDRMGGFMTRLAKMPKSLRSWEAYSTLKSKLENFEVTLPLLEYLSKPSIKPRHWTELMEITGSQFRIDGDFRLETLLGLNLDKYGEDVEELTDGADKQLAIEAKIKEISERWAVEKFVFQDWKARRIPVLRATGAIIEELEESQLQCQTMLTMRHVKPFRTEVQALLTRLSDATDTLEQWLKVQQLWCSLESVFTGGDIAKQMPVQAKKFNKVDKEWAKVMAKSASDVLVLTCCEDENLREFLPPSFVELEGCQKALDGYLEKKREMFPRFYFVSNPVLLQILSQGSDPQMIQPYYQTVFDAIDHVIHDEDNAREIITMVSRFKGAEEEIPFSTPIMAVGNIEEWLAKMKIEQQYTMKEICRSCSEQADELMEQASVDPLRSFVDNMPPQYALLGIQLTWTQFSIEAFEKNRTQKNSISDLVTQQTNVLLELSSWCLEDLSTKMIRTKYETLITIQVHQRDVLGDINSLNKQRKFSGVTDFEWLKQARFGWDPNAEDDVDDDGALIISCTDVAFNYMFEYLGCKGRLVITPLTDRCYVTLSQALGMCYGGAPAGPAGTGKTETVKDMGRALGIYVIVTNCTDQATYSSMGKIYKGLCMAGLWGCFDEFNRIALPVLSVVAQQVLAILDAKRTGSKMLTFPGDPQEIGFDSACGFFITMNPGYAGRQELPENLKALFRGVTMMVPDRMIIIRVLLCAVGYSEFADLSRKFTILYMLCEEQLSKQRHYDFGLRNILSVLRTAGKTKRDNRDGSEAVLLYQTLRDMNLSKMVAQDVPLFLSLLKDLFPTLTAPPVAVYSAVEDAIKAAVIEMGLIHYKPWITKVIQLYETTEVRHGIMVIGPTGGGKTEIFRILRMALASVNGFPFKEARLNPKAILAKQMYGEIDPMSDEWTTGVFAATWTRYNNRANPYNTWIVCDGPVDAIWIEDLNTVLDDNQILTLANGDRIPMTDNTKIMFENETLINASPATVSRCGIIYVSQSDLGWTPIVQSWNKLNSKNDPDLTKFKDLCLKCFYKYAGDNETPADPGPVFNLIARECTPVMSAPKGGAMKATTRTLDGLWGHCSVMKCKDVELMVERLFLFALTWGAGGLLEYEDRRKWDAFLREQAGDSADKVFPTYKNETDTIYDYWVDEISGEWIRWSADSWEYPHVAFGGKLEFASLLVPTSDSTRALYIIKQNQVNSGPILITGSQGTAKTSTALMWSETFDSEVMGFKFINFSSASVMINFQNAIEESLDKRGGKNFGPPNGKSLTVFIDDVSMPTINEWGDQPTNEIVRQLVEFNNFAFLDKDKRGDMKVCEDLKFIAAMTHPGGGRNDIPNRLKRHFLLMNLIPPSIEAINDIYGQILNGYFQPNEDPEFAELGGVNVDESARGVINNLTALAIGLWNSVRDKLKATPAKFHYVFTMRDLSRIFQGVLATDLSIVNSGGMVVADEQLEASVVLARLLKHEAERVFCDRLTNNKDKDTYQGLFKDACTKFLGEELNEAVDVKDNYFVDFFREDKFDEDDILIEYAPKVYELGGSLDNIRERALWFMGRYNEANPATPLGLVLFDDALRHMCRISRIIQMPRGNALLVGVGGSGKQSLTKLAAFIARHRMFQVKLTKTYNTVSFGEDLKECMIHAGTVGPVSFLFTDAQIKKEEFLELINATLLTGDVPGLFSKEEMMGATADVSAKFSKAHHGVNPTPEKLRAFFINLVRENLHLCLCMSPANPKFPKRARLFPGVIAGCTINWFLTWPQDALVAVSRGFIGDFNVECTPSEKEQLMIHMGEVHNMAVACCDEYFAKMRRNVYQTPKSFLSFISDFKTMYSTKLSALKKKAANVALGLQKLEQGATDVAAMKIVLADQQVKLGIATEETNKMLAGLEISSAEALKESKIVGAIKSSCESDRTRIQGEKTKCMADLAKAQPYVDDANKAIDSIKAGDVGEVKVLKKPSDIIKLVFDCVLILFYKPLNPIKPTELNIKKQAVPFFEASWAHALPFMSQSDFLKQLQYFGKGDPNNENSIAGKDLMNAETIELLSAYIDLELFTPQNAKSASQAAEGLCKFCVAMKFYYEASKLIKPKLEALAVAEGQLATAEKKLAEAMVRLDACNARLAELTATFDKQMAEKTRIERGAKELERKMDQATQLIDGLAGERVRWAADSKQFGMWMKQLVGDCAVACAFVSYCGAFNQEFRLMMINDRFRADCSRREIPVSSSIEVTEFLVDQGTIGEWNLQGLPTDILSTQNGILVTRSSRFPLMIDPQAQAISWIKNKEQNNLPKWKETNISSKKLKDELEFCMSEGKAMIVVGVEEEVDPLLDPVMQKELVKKGRSMYITVADQQMDYDPAFMLYFVTRLPKPHFSPELQAMTTVIDFAVTMKGLEDQLLGIVIGQEQRALQDQLQEVLAECNANTKTLQVLDAELLERLSSGTGNLLDDTELVGVLNNTKQKANEVQAALATAIETRANIDVKREQFRPVATRGSVLYFSIVETSQINVMYQTSLQQFLVLFLKSMTDSEPARIVATRVANIADFLTYCVYRYINRGLYEVHKLNFVFIVTLKVLVVAGTISQSDVGVYLRGGAALNIDKVKKKPFAWLSNEAWLNVIEISQKISFFKDLPENIGRNEVGWHEFYEDNAPERAQVPDYETAIQTDTLLGPWFRLVILRTLRLDRSMLAIKDFIKGVEEIGPRYVEPVTDLLETIYDEMVKEIPALFLLSVGADPTDAIITLCRKRKCTLIATISMGEGQEKPAMAAIEKAAESGGWVLLQNCELGLELMNKMEDIIVRYREGPAEAFHDDFRLFITAAPDPNFPLGLLQMGTKVTNEPPSGLRAGLMRSYTTTVDQDRMERVDGNLWKRLLFVMCMLHSVVQERRKFGPLGWNIPYEYNLGDITASLQFLEKHLYSGAISWSTVQYMVSEIQYGGKITDDFDRRLFNTYAERWLNPIIEKEEFTFNPDRMIGELPDNFHYIVPLFQEQKEYYEYVSKFPEIDTPEVSGLHPNADLTYRLKEATTMFKILMETQPKDTGGGSGGGMSTEDIVKARAADLLETTPPEYNEDRYLVKIRALGGLDVPLNIFLYQEIRVIEFVVKKVRNDLVQLSLAIDGEVVMTDALATIIDQLFNANVPRVWMYDATNNEFSWINSTIGLWYANFTSRNQQIRDWLNKGRPTNFFLRGFFNPQGFLTSMKQEVTRKHKNDGWALDDMVYHTEMTDFDSGEQVRSSPKEGAYISAAFLDGARWSKMEGSLVESEPKKLFDLMPVMWITATTQPKRKEKIKTGMFGPLGPYNCPMYKYPIRQARFFICVISMASKAADGMLFSFSSFYCYYFSACSWLTVLLFYFQNHLI
jgi:dynein heavy chain